MSIRTRRTFIDAKSRSCRGYSDDLPVPRLLWSFDEGPGGWVVLCFEDIDGRNPVMPWDEQDLSAVIAAYGRDAATPDARAVRDAAGG